MEGRPICSLGGFGIEPCASRLICIATFRSDGFTSQDCGRLAGNTSLLVANRKQPHRGDPVLFSDEDNTETAYKPCRDGPFQAARTLPFTDADKLV